MLFFPVLGIYPGGRPPGPPGVGFAHFRVCMAGIVSPVTLIDLAFFRKALTVAATDVRPKITLACQECKHRNYITKKNRRNDPDRLELKKFCPNCRCHTAHRETR